MSGEENVPTSSKEIKKRRSYTIDQKLEVIKFARSSSRNAASRKFNIARHCVSQWMRNEQSLIELQASTSEMSTKMKRRMPGAGRHVKNEDLDDRVADWIRNELINGHAVTRGEIQEKALQMFQENRAGGREFKASAGWLEKFLQRHNFQSTRNCGIWRVELLSPSPIAELAEVDRPSLAEFAKQMCEERGCDQINVVYRIGVLIDSFGELSFESETFASNGEKLQVTLILSARSDGHKLIPFVILPHDTQSSSANSTFHDKLHIKWSDRTDFNDALLIDYIKATFEHETGRKKRLLLWNRFDCQIDEDLKEFLDKFHIENMRISTGDVAAFNVLNTNISGDFQSKLLEQHRNWMVNGESETAFNGNLGPLSMNLFLNWLVNAWTSIPETSVSSMFDNASTEKDTQLNGHQKSNEETQQLTGTSFLDNILSLVNEAS